MNANVQIKVLLLYPVNSNSFLRTKIYNNVKKQPFLHG